MKRNPYIAITRFIAALSIAVYHFEWVYIGKPVLFQHFYIWVEYFFVLSGFFVGIYVKKNLDDSKGFSLIDAYNCSITYLKKQMKKQYPLYLLCFCLSFFVYLFVNSIKNINEILSKLWYARWEILMLSPFLKEPHEQYNYVGPPYQIPITLIGGVCIICFLYMFPKIFKLVAPIVSVIGIYVILKRFGNLSQWQGQVWFVQAGVIRGICEMMVGCFFSMYIMPHLKFISEHKTIMYIMLLFEIFAIIFLIAGMRYISYYDLSVYILLFAILDILEYLKESKNDGFFMSVSNRVDKMSYPLFLLHGSILRLLSFLIPNKGYIMVIMYCFLILILSYVFSMKKGELAYVFSSKNKKN